MNEPRRSRLRTTDHWQETTDDADCAGVSAYVIHV
jgi:hypothetical protein